MPPLLFLFSAILHCSVVAAEWNLGQPNRFPEVPSYGPDVPKYGPDAYPFYMMDNVNNYWHVAPDKGTPKPAWPYSGSFENYMAKLRANKTSHGNLNTTTYGNSTYKMGRSLASEKLHQRQSSDYWLTSLAPLGKQPLAGTNYTFYRDVTAYGAKGDGSTDDVEAINAAIQDGNRCGLECGSTFAQGAIVYFPPGTYKICTPIVQLYYTQFISDPNNRAIIQGCDTFVGIALIDTDPYIPGGNGQEWYVNQNQFFRHIRNLVFDLTQMPLATNDDGQPLVPTGIHWQVAQATTLQNLLFKMPIATDTNGATHVGIFMENGSGGFVSDLEFQGGAIGWRAGSQQYTARNLKFTNCLTAVQMVWAWGFNWQGIEVTGGAIAFNISGAGGNTGQGTGSVSIIDCTITDVPVGILTTTRVDGPNIVIRNLAVDNVGSIVQDSGGGGLLGGSLGQTTIPLWACGKRYYGQNGQNDTGIVTGVPSMPSSLLNSNGSIFTRSRPQYETLTTSDFLVATSQGILNDGTGDQTDLINKFLVQAQSSGSVAYFPAGIYQVQGMVFIPTGSKVQGASWSQIMGTGSYFGDMENPQVMVQVGNPGDVGSIEIVEMLFTVKGPTAGAILLEWNVQADSQGSAGMWDSHFRVGGATGSDLDINACPKYGLNENCIASSLMLHVTPQASGYFENVWAWVADHDNDMDMYYQFDPTANQVSVFGGRGMLIESQGPSWFYGTGSEHSVLYQYQLYQAKDIFMGHIQTETPYYQPVPAAPGPFKAGQFPADPTFADCTTGNCPEAWALRIVDSSDITIYSAGMYSFFDNFGQDCITTEDCQERIMQVTGSEDVVLFNIFTIASVQVASGINNTRIFQNDSNQSGFTTEISVWLPLDGDDEVEIVYVGTEVYAINTATCTAPCIFVLPPSALPNTTTITIPSYTTSLEVGHLTTTTNTQGATVTTYIESTIIVTLFPTAITTNSIQFSNINVTAGQTGGGYFIPTISIDLPPLGVPLTEANGTVTTRTVHLPPWPAITNGPPGDWIISPGPWQTGSPVTSAVSWTGITSSTTSATGPPLGQTYGWNTIAFTDNFVTTVQATAPTTTTLSIPPYQNLTINCPPTTTFDGITLQCPTSTATVIEFACPTTTVITLTGSGPSTGTFSIPCIAYTVSAYTAPPTTTTVSGIPLPIYTSWPPGSIVPISTSVSDPEPTGSGSKTPCKLWFFFICIEFEIGGWFWSFPPGIYPPGPPPPWGIDPPPGWTIEGPLPDWPQITIGPNHVPTYSEEPESECTTQSASICSTTLSYGITITSTTVGGTPSQVTETIATDTMSTCATIYGCEIENETTTITTSGCTAGLAKRAMATVVPRADDQPNYCIPDDFLDGNCIPDDFPDDNVIYPADPRSAADLAAIQNYLQTNPEGADQKWWDLQGTQQIQASSKELGGFTAFFYVPNLPWSATKDLNSMDEVLCAYPVGVWSRRYQPNYSNNGYSSFSNGGVSIIESEDGSSYGSEGGVPIVPEDNPYVDSKRKRHFIEFELGSNHTYEYPERRSSIQKREGTSQVPPSIYWELSQVSTPPNAQGGWYGDKRIRHARSETDPTIVYEYYYDDSAAAGQYVYLIEDATYPNTAELAVPNPIEYEKGAWSGANSYGPIQAPDDAHGTSVVSKVGGVQLGVAKESSMSVIMNTNGGVIQQNKNGHDAVPERYLESLLRAADDITGNELIYGEVVINLSFSIGGSKHPDALYMRMLDILQVLDGLQTVMVASMANNYPGENGYPAAFANPTNKYGYLENLIAVESSDRNGRKATTTPLYPWITTFAPGAGIYLATDTGINDGDGRGTSFATPLVAGLAAYLRGLPSQWKDDLQNPRNVKALIRQFHRSLLINDPDVVVTNPTQPNPPIIWNGQVFGKSCLLDIDDESLFKSNGGPCPDLPPPGELDSLPVNGGEQVGGSGGSCPVGAGGLARRDGSGGCGLGITYEPGPPGPTCTAQCGHLCTGYYCVPNPTGINPDFIDPQDPAATPTAPTSSLPTPPPTSTTSVNCPTTPIVSCNGSGCVTSMACYTPPPPLSSTTVTDCYLTTTVECNGSGAESACVTQQVCTTQPYPTLTTSTVTNTASCVSSTTVTSCIGSGQQGACTTLTSCAVYATPPPPSSTPTPTPTSHCLYFSIEAQSEFTTSWSATVYDNNVQVCNALLTDKTDTPTFSCTTAGPGYSLRVDDTNPTLDYLPTWYTSPLTNGEIYFEVPLYSYDDEDCEGDAPVSCTITVWQSGGFTCS